MVIGALTLCGVATHELAATAGGAFVFENYQLRNGLEVIMSRDDRLPIVTVNLWYHVGAVHEPPGRSGFAHLFEHMMFQGSQHVAASQHLAMLEQAGATDLNASTDFDRTNYFQTVPSNWLERVLWLESDRMGFFIQALTPEKFQVQREVVQNERRQRVESTPYGLAEESAWQALFPKPHPYFGDVIGSSEDLEAATLDEVREFFQTYYTPANATLAVVGDFDPQRLRADIDKYFASLPNHGRPKLNPPDEARIERPISLRRTLRPGTLPMVWLGWHSPRALTREDAAADVLSTVLTTGKSSRLYRRLLHDKSLAQSVSARQQSLAAQSAFVIEAIARPGVTPEQLLKEIDAELQYIREQPIAQDELKRAQALIKTAIVTSVETLSGRAERMQFYNQYTGNPGHLPNDLARYDEVTPEQVQALARSVLAPKHRVTMLAASQPQPQVQAHAHVTHAAALGGE
jgi:predicted Zn-dependent peptidase